MGIRDARSRSGTSALSSHDSRLPADGAEAHAAAPGRRRVRIVIVGACALALALATLYASALWSLSQTDRSRREAQSRFAALQSAALLGDDPNLAAQLAWVSLRLADTDAARSAVVDATGVDVPTRWFGPARAVVAAAANGSLVARAAGNGSVTVWRGDELRWSPGTSFVADPTGGALLTADVSMATGRTLLAVGGRGAAGVWDVTAAPRLVQDVRSAQMGAATTAAAFTADGRELAVGSSTGAIELWSVSASGGLQRSASVKLRSEVTALTFDPVTDELYALGSSPVVARFSAGLQPRRLPDVQLPSPEASPVARSIAVRPDGRQLAVGLADGRVLRWSRSGGRAVMATALTSVGGAVNSLAYSADGASLMAGDADGTTCRYDSESGQVQDRMKSAASVSGVAFAGAQPLTTGVDGTLLVWPSAGPVARRGAAVQSLSASREAGVVAAAAADEGALLWNVAAVLRPLPRPSAAAEAASAVGIAPDGSSLVAGTTDGAVLSWLLSDGGAGPQHAARAFPGTSITATAVSARGFVVAVPQAGDGVAGFRLGADGSLVRTGTIATGAARAAVFSADGGVLAVLTHAGDVQLWVTGSDGSATAMTTITGLGSPATAVAFAGRSPVLAVAAESGQVTFWNVEQADLPVRLGDITDQGSAITALRFTADDQQLVVGRVDGSITVWGRGGDATAALRLTGGVGRVTGLELAGAGTTLVAAGANGVVRTWTLDAWQSAGSSCSGWGNPMTPQEWSRYLPGVAPIGLC